MMADYAIVRKMRDIDGQLIYTPPFLEIAYYAGLVIGVCTLIRL